MKRGNKRIRWYFEVVLLLVISFPLALLPLNLSRKFGAALGAMVYSIWSKRRKIAEENIARSIEVGAISSSESPQDMAKKCFKNFGVTLIEVLKIYYGFGNRILDKVEIKGLENYKRASEKKRGIILITGHCGNWEVMALIMGLRVCLVNVLARRQDNPLLNNIIEKVRLKSGNKLMYKEGALREILTTLRRDETVGILMDQAVLRDEGFVIDFLGRKAWTTKMPALIARKTNAPVIPIFIHREMNRHVIEIFPEVALSEKEDRESAVIEDTARFTAFIESYIKEHPSEWLWIHNRWKRTEGLSQ